MRPRCRLCDRRAVEDSLFCDRHREQAERFSLSFGKQKEPPEPAAEAEPEAPTPEPDSSPDEPSPEKSVAEVSPPEKAADTAASQPGADEDRTVLSAVFHSAFDELRTRLKENADPERWPQLSLYFLDDVLHCRAYFSIVPHTDEAPTPAYALDDDRVHATLATGGTGFEELAARFSEASPALHEQTVQTLDIHFLTYAGLIAINAHPPGGKISNLATLKLDDNGFRQVDLDDDVRALMLHDHW